MAIAYLFGTSWQDKGCFMDLCVIIVKVPALSLGIRNGSGGIFKHCVLYICCCLVNVEWNPQVRKNTIGTCPD